MPRNNPELKVVDNGNQESGRKSRGPAVNRVTLVGRLASDPELRYAQRQRSCPAAAGHQPRPKLLLRTVAGPHGQG